MHTSRRAIAMRVIVVLVFAASTLEIDGLENTGDQSTVDYSEMEVYN